ncbi:hypothetical protein GJ496_007570 [Pomphorhynchus laevis]|nr:hypothetical protein GJ496_007570 [Pomphorhynchus laevis]
MCDSISANLDYLDNGVEENFTPSQNIHSNFELKLLKGSILQSLMNVSFTNQDPLIIELRPGSHCRLNDGEECLKCKRCRPCDLQEHVVPKRAKYARTATTLQNCIELNVSEFVNISTDNLMEVDNLSSKRIIVQGGIFITPNYIEIKEAYSRELEKCKMSALTPFTCTATTELKHLESNEMSGRDRVYEIQDLQETSKAINLRENHEMEPNDSHTINEFEESTKSESKNELRVSRDEQIDSYANLMETTGISILIHPKDSASVRKSYGMHDFVVDNESLTSNDSHAFIEFRGSAETESLVNELKTSSEVQSNVNLMESTDINVMMDTKDENSLRKSSQQLVRDLISVCSATSTSLSTDNDGDPLSQLVWDNVNLKRLQEFSEQKGQCIQHISTDKNMAVDTPSDSPVSQESISKKTPEYFAVDDSRLINDKNGPYNYVNPEDPPIELIRYVQNLSNLIVSPKRSDPIIAQCSLPTVDCYEPAISNSWQESFTAARSHHATRQNESSEFRNIEIKNKIEESIINSSLVLACLEITKSRINERKRLKCQGSKFLREFRRLVTRHVADRIVYNPETNQGVTSTLPINSKPTKGGYGILGPPANQYQSIKLSDVKSFTLTRTKSFVETAEKSHSD